MNRSGEARAVAEDTVDSHDVDAHDRLTLQVYAALNQSVDESQIRDIELELQDFQRAVEARAFLGVAGDERAQYRHARVRIAERPGDENWEADVWLAFQAAKDVPSGTSEETLKRELTKAEVVQATRAQQAEHMARQAGAAGWPSQWPSSLYEIWREHGGTTKSARAWAAAGHNPAEVLLGDPPSPDAMQDLVSRVRNEQPLHRTDPTVAEHLDRDSLITPEEADRRIQEHYARIDRDWEVAYRIAVKIAELRGIEDPAIQFAGHDADGEQHVCASEGFFCHLGDDHLVTLERGDAEDGSQEDLYWRELETALNELYTGLPPMGDGNATGPEDLYGDEHDLRLKLFADYDVNGYFQYDEKGVRSIIAGVWL